MYIGTLCLQRKHTEQILLNNQLMSELSELQQEARLIQEIPRKLCECAANCKDVYIDVLSMTQVILFSLVNFFFPTSICWYSIAAHNILAMQFLSLQSFISDGKSSTSKLLSSMSEIGWSLFTALETHFSMVLESPFSRNDHLIQEQHKVLCERMKTTITSLVSSERASLEDHNVMNSLCRCEHKVAACSRLSRYNSLVVIFFSTILLACFFFNCMCL